MCMYIIERTFHGETRYIFATKTNGYTQAKLTLVKDIEDASVMTSEFADYLMDEFDLARKKFKKMHVPGNPSASSEALILRKRCSSFFENDDDEDNDDCNYKARFI